MADSYLSRYDPEDQTHKKIKLVDLGGGLYAISVGGALTATVDSEFPAAVALNGTILKSVSTPVVGAALLVSDNTNLIQPLGDAANGLDVDVTRLPAGTNHIGQIGGSSIVIGDETTVPAGTPTYAAGDAVAAAITDTATTVLRSLAVGRVAAGSGYITRIRLMTDQATCTARFRVHFYTLAAPTGAVVGDDVQMTLLYLNKACRIGHIDLPALATSTVATSSTAAVAQDVTTRMQFKCAAADQNIYYRLETLDAFTRAASQKFYLEVAAEQD